MISIEVQKTKIELGKTDIGIRCLVNDSGIESITVIQLLKNDTNTLSVTSVGVKWQDKELERRAVANGNVSNPTSSYLQMKIDKKNVTENDGGTYFCASIAQYRNKSTLNDESKKEILNITGNYIFQL